MANLGVINQVLILFLIIGVGYIARKIGILNKELNKGFSDLLLKITLPFMIIGSFNHKFSPEMMKNIKSIFIYSSLIHILLIPLSKAFYIKFPKDRDKKDILRFVTVFSNCGFMGYPVLQSIYGNIGILYASVFNIPFTIFSWTFGVMLFTKDKESRSLKKVMTNPGIIAVIIGVVIFLFSIKLPYALMNTLNLVGSITTPVSMILIGSMLAEVKFSDIFKETSIYYASIIRLLVIPIIIYYFMNFCGIDKFLINIAVIVEAMPAAAICSIFAESYGKNPKYASQSVFITTMLSIITIPLILMIIK
ncbi:AEC family transporter [Haloimpatiens massiliensis]|uniref:AEC family transporter n=1 Tax=Haloimpatiens massiliensis TaxID=1658110 RepID=UPI000C8406A9|nr:AEC family transporter [Haloimpatiens massiliensis]